MTGSPPSTLSRSLGRPPVKQQAIVDVLRREIFEGVLPPGSRLSTRRDLVIRFGGSLQTVQQALDQLVRERFVEVRGTSGTFVTGRPPNLHDYALIFPAAPFQPEFRRFWTALGNEAKRLNDIPGSARRISAFYGVDGHMDGEDFQRLAGLVQNRRLAGLIFGSSPFKLAGTVLMDQPDIPRVVIGNPSIHYDGIPQIHLDTLSFLRRAFEHLGQKRRRRVGVVCVVELEEAWHREFARQVKSRRMSTRPYWKLELHPALGASIRSIAHLLMNPGQGERPDALIITDDNLVEPITAGLIDAGVRVPEDLEIVAHCNFPWPTPSVVPARRLGFDAREVLSTCLKSIDAQRDARAAGTSPSCDPIVIDARFENEILTPTESLS